MAAILTTTGIWPSMIRELVHSVDGFKSIRSALIKPWFLGYKIDSNCPHFHCISLGAGGGTPGGTSTNNRGPGQLPLVLYLTGGIGRVALDAHGWSVFCCVLFLCFFVYMANGILIGNMYDWSSSRNTLFAMCSLCCWYVCSPLLFHNPPVYTQIHRFRENNQYSIPACCSTILVDQATEKDRNTWFYIYITMYFVDAYIAAAIYSAAYDLQQVIGLIYQ